MEATADARNLLRLQRTVTTPASVEDSIQCPSCDTQLKRCEVAQHCEQELRQLQLKASSSSTSSVTEAAAGSTTAAAKNIDESTTNDAEQRRKPWTVFQRVQRNRQSRLKQRSRKRPVAAQPAVAVVEQQVCPICNQSYPQEEIQRHAEQCLRRSSSTNGRGGGDDSSNDDEDGDGEYEEYEWAGQKRIRVSSLLQGGYASIGIGQPLSSTHNGIQNGTAENADEEEEDLNVDEDDTQIYGPAQYCEGDVITTASDGSGCSGAAANEGNLTNYMRRLITGQNHQVDSVYSSSTASRTENNTMRTTTTTERNENYIPQAEGDHDDDNDTKTLTTLPAVAAISTQQQQNIIIDSLKAKLRYYENHVQSKFKCLICLDDYRNPAISVCCWHVHCEECWLRSLGARKLCPQCNLITTPKDLRRIYM